MGLVPARAWGAVGIDRTERLKLRRPMAVAAISLSVFLEVCGLEVEEELSTMATQTKAEAA